MNNTIKIPNPNSSLDFDFWNNDYIIDENIGDSEYKFHRDDNNCENKINMTRSEINFMELEVFESKLSPELSKEKKMSLLIVVLLQMVFNNNNTKLEQIYDFLNKKNILDLEVTKKNYGGLRQNLSLLIESVNNQNLSTNEKLINNFESISNSKCKKNKFRSNFNQIKLLGQGAYGLVFKVYHKFEKKFYAIKKIFITKEIIKDNYDIFKEIQIYSELQSDNIVRYYSSWVEIDFESIVEYNKNDLDENEKINYLCPILFIQMELCDFTLKEYLLSYSQDDSIENKINILKQICCGLNYLNSKNIIHRDIKPDNIFIKFNNIDNNNIVKLGDFGLCKKYLYENINKNEITKTIDIYDNLTNDNYLLLNDLIECISSENLDNSEDNKDKLYLKSININKNINSENLYLDNRLLNSMSKYIGTGIYRAPEIEFGKYDSKIDVYSIGIIMFELFYNFKTNSEKINIISKIKLNEFNISNFDIITNKSIRNILVNLLDNNPSNRYELKILIEKINLIK